MRYNSNLFQEPALEQFFDFLHKSPLNLVLLGLSIVSGILLIYPFLTRGLRTAEEVGPAQAVLLMNRKEALVLDVREEVEFATGHINGARQVAQKQVGSRIKEFIHHKEKPVIVCCASGRRASSVADVLRKNGFTQVSVLQGGVAAWLEAGLPLEK